MSLSPGARLGPYEILAAIGAGGMGEVYKARDTRLHREVAVKVLPALFASDPDRRTRFEREAQAVAALSHPHILALHDVGVHDGIAYAVTELLEGETLRERLSSGPLLVRKAVDYGVQIARGLAAAHGKGVVHRDLKPDNIFLVAGGQLKILDFGLARSMVHDEGSTMALQTEPGTVLGTVGYMAPEQVRGQSIDPRTDLFAFGAVLYEMLSGTRAFQRETPAETMTAILHEEPPELTGIRAALPPALDRIVRHCLEKNPGDRFQSATDVAFALDALSGSSSQPLPGGPAVALTSQEGAASRARSRLMWVLACGASALAAAWIVWSVRPPTARASAYLAIPLPAGDALEDHGVPLLALTPDGSALVYAAVRGGVQRLFRRPLDDFRADPISDTDGASMPFFSADGKWIGFFTQGKLRKVPLDGGAPPVDVADAPDGRGASWARDGTIAFVPHLFAAISRIASSSGAKPEPLAKLEIHHWPDMLPDGRTVVYAVGGHDLVTWDDAQIVAQPLGGGDRRVLVRGGTHPRYVSTGHLLYMRRGTLLAVKFDPSRLEVSGTPVPIVKGIAESVYGAGQYTVSATGTLAYIPGKTQTNDHVLSWVDASGLAQPLPLQPRTYWAPKVSPDGRTIALSILGPTTDVWTYDLARETLTRLSVEATKSPQIQFAYPVWTPDGKRIVYAQPKDGGAPNLFWRNADGSGAQERLTTSDDLQIANCWLPDGQTLLFTEFHLGPTTPGALLEGNADLMTLRVDGDRKPQPFQQTPFDEWGAACSPDGRWIAYLSNESGRMEVYVRPFRGSGEKWKISNGSGMEPVWSRDGKQLFFRGGVNQELMMAVPIGTTPTFSAGKPARLFQGRYYWDPNANFDVAPDGRFLMMPTPDSGGRQEIRIVQNWFEELRRRVP